MRRRPELGGVRVRVRCANVLRKNSYSEMFFLSPYIRQFHLGLRRLARLRRVGSREDAAAHRRGDRAADHAVEPMVVVRLGTHLPLVHLASAPFGLDAVLGGEMLGEEHVPFRLAPPEREASSVAHRGEEAARHKRLPVVRVEHDVPHSPLAAYVRDAPVVADAVPAL